MLKLSYRLCVCIPAFTAVGQLLWLSNSSLLLIFSQKLPSPEVIPPNYLKELTFSSCFPQFPMQAGSSGNSAFFIHLTFYSLLISVHITLSATVSMRGSAKFLCASSSGAHRPSSSTSIWIASFCPPQPQCVALQVEIDTDYIYCI